MRPIATIRHRAAICGHVVDDVSGRGIAGARVAIEALDLTTLSGPDGFFGFIDLAEGPYELTATAPALGSRYGSAAASGQVQSTDDGRPILDPVELRLRPTQLRGDVRRADDSAPVRRAQVRLRASAIAVFADAEGAYAFSAVEAGRQTVVVSAPGFGALTREVLLTAGQETQADFDLTAP